MTNYFQILLGSYPVAAVSSQSLLDTIMTLIAGGWLFLVYRQGVSANRIRLLGIEWAFAAYFVIVVLGLAINATAGAPWISNLLKFSWMINLYFLIFAIEKTKFSLSRTLVFVSCLILLPTIYSLVSYYFGTDIITGRDNVRITGLVNSATYHAHGNGVILVFLSGLLLFTYKKMNRVLVGVCAISLLLLGISILLTFTRGIWLSIFFSTIIMSAIISYKRTLLLILGFAVLTVGLFLAWPKFQDRMLHTKNVAANMERINLFNVNVQMWKEHPILGIGYGENVRRNREYWDRPEWNMPPEYMTSHAHNQFLNVLTTTGVLGLIPFLIFMTFFFVKNIKVLKRTTPGSVSYILLFCCLWGQIEFLLACLTDVSFEYAKIRALLVLIWAIVVATERKLEAGSTDTI